MIKKRVHHIDCNHSWLQVPEQDTIELGLRAGACLDGAKVAGRALYLSEDEGMGEYLEAAEAAGWIIERVEKNYDDLCDFIRTLPTVFDLAGGEAAVFCRLFGTR